MLKNNNCTDFLPYISIKMLGQKPLRPLYHIKLFS